MKRILLIILIFISISSCKHHSRVWTNEYYRISYQYVDSINKGIFRVDSQRKQMTKWEIERLKVELPDGLSSVSHDSLIRLCARIGQEYSKTHNPDDLQAKLAWTPEAETEFKRSISASSFIKSMDLNLRDNYCDCMLTEIKKRYQDSISFPIPDSIYINSVHECNVKLSVGKK
jgi:hypothetical protein